MINLAQQGYTHSEIIDRLSYPKGSRNAMYRIDVLRNGAVVTTAEHLQCTYECDSTANAKYRASMTLLDNPLINWSTDYLQPVMVLTTETGKQLEFRFCPLRPITIADTRRNGMASKAVEAYDDIIFLEDNSIGEVLTIPKGTLYTAAINQLLERAGFAAGNITPTAKAIQTDREDWSEDTSIIDIINQLLQEIGYNSLSIGLDGIPTATPYMPPSLIHAGIQYTDKHNSIVLPDIQIERDGYKKPNRFIGVVDNPDLDNPLRYEFINDDPSSPTSTINTGRTVTAYQTYDNIADFDTLVNNVQKWAAEISQSYEVITLPTRIMPHHAVQDTVLLDLQGLSALCTEMAWSISDLSADGIMTHTLGVVK